MQQIELEIGSVVDIISKPGKIVLKAFFIPIPCSKNNCDFQRSSLRLEKLSQQRSKLAAGGAPLVQWALQYTATYLDPASAGVVDTLEPLLVTSVSPRMLCIEQCVR